MLRGLGLRRRRGAKGEGEGEGGIVSMGAYGAIMRPSQEFAGRYDEAHTTREQLRAWHLRQDWGVYAGRGRGGGGAKEGVLG